MKRGRTRGASASKRAARSGKATRGVVSRSRKAGAKRCRPAKTIAKGTRKRTRKPKPSPTIRYERLTGANDHPMPRGIVIWPADKWRDRKETTYFSSGYYSTSTVKSADDDKWYGRAPSKVDVPKRPGEGSW